MARSLSSFSCKSCSGLVEAICPKFVEGTCVGAAGETLDFPGWELLLVNLSSGSIRISPCFAQRPIGREPEVPHSRRSLPTPTLRPDCAHPCWSRLLGAY